MRVNVMHERNLAQEGFDALLDHATSVREAKARERARQIEASRRKQEEEEMEMERQRQIEASRLRQREAEEKERELELELEREREREKQRATQAESSRLGQQEEASFQRQGRQSALGSYSRLRVCDVDDFFADNFVHQSMMRQPSDSGSWTSRSDDARRDHLGLHSVAHANTSSIIPASNVHPGSWIQRSPSANGPQRDSVVHSVMEASPRLYKSWDGAQVPYNQQQTLVNPHAGAFLIILDPRPQSICSDPTSFASVPLRNDFGAMIFYKTSVNSCTSNPAPTDFF